MTLIVLISYVALAALPLPWLLRRSRWTVRAPRLAIAAWLSLAGSALTGLLLLACQLVERAIGTVGHTLWLSCLRMLTEGRLSLGEAAQVTAAVVIAVVPLARVVLAFFSSVFRLHRQQREHVSAVDLLGRAVASAGPTVLAIPHGQPAAYCLAAKRGRIVVTTTALARLPHPELRALLEHEKAHLRGRHHLLKWSSAALSRALPCIPLFAWTGAAVARLIEMAADDAAARHASRETVARSLALLVAGGHEGYDRSAGSIAMHATGAHVAERINRLLDGGRVERTWSLTKGLGWVTCSVGLPAALALSTAPFWC